MDHIDEHLATAATDNKYSLTIKAALAIGKKTLNQYYDKTNHSELQWVGISHSFYSISLAYPCLVLHPLVLQERKVAGQLDRQGRGYHLLTIWPFIQILGHIMGQPSRNSTCKCSCKFLWFFTVNDMLMDDSFFFRLTNHHRTSLTTCLHFKHPKLWSYMVSWTGIWVLILSMSRMPLPGGMNTSTFTLTFIRWRWIIC